MKTTMFRMLAAAAALFGAQALVSANAADPAAAPAAKPEASGNRLARNGVVVDFSLKPVGIKGELMASQLAEVRFRISEAATAQPMRSVRPGAWIDIGAVMQGQVGAQQKSCKEKVSLYMQGAVGIRPMIDLNNYFVLVMNAEPSISVIDPLVSMAGNTSTLAQIPLPGPGADWARSTDGRRLFVSVPRTGKLVVVDTESFKPIKEIAVGKTPMRVALQPDGRYVWVGDDADAAGAGVSIVDVETLQVVGRVPTGRGHHEIAFSDDSRRAFVSNRDAGTVSVIDIADKAKVKDLALGPLPISLAWGSQARMLYVADGKAGTVSVVDGATLATVKTVALKSGLGPMRATPDGRYLLVVNPGADTVYAIDSADNELANTIPITGEPYQLSYTETFAYVRALRSERVSMIALRTLGRGTQPTVQSVAAGAQPPAKAGTLALADSITSAAGSAEVLIVNPADNTTYFYMEGMNSASSNYQVRGGSARAVTVIDRSLKEVEPGVYAAKVMLPAPGRYDVAFLMESPQVLHCFSAEAKPNPLAPVLTAPLRVEFDETQRTATVGEKLTLRFRIFDGASGQPRSGLADARVMYYLAPGRGRTEVAVQDLGEGRYQFELPVAMEGAYYVYLGVPSMRIRYGELPFFSVRALPGQVPPRAGNG